MALTVGTQAADATPATTLMNVFDDLLTAANWEEETTRTYTKELMGTTAACRVFVSPATTNGAGTPVAGNPSNITSGTYTGCILTFEIDDTNTRIRIRAQEKFRSDLAAPTALTGVTCVVATDLFTKTTHGLTTGDIVVFDTFVNITGVTANFPYAVIASGLTANDFRVSTMVGSTTINVGGTDGSASVYKLPLITKWGVYGGTENSITYTANYAQDDNFVAHGQPQFDPRGLAQALTLGSGKNTALEISCAAGGFNYWMGVNANRFLLVTNSGGQPWVGYGGHLPYSGDLNTSVGNAVVFLMAGIQNASTLISGMWSVVTSSGSADGILRTSREPVSGGETAQLSMFLFHIAPLAGTWGDNASGAITAGNPFGSGISPLHYYSGSFLMYPMWAHGASLFAGSRPNAKGRSNFAKFPEMFVMPLPANYPLVAPNRAYGPNLGEIVTSGGVTYLSLSMVDPGNGVTGGGSSAAEYVFVDGSQF